MQRNVAFDELHRNVALRKGAMSVRTTRTKTRATAEPPAQQAALREPGPRKREAIVEATLELLAEHGYEGLTIEGVAQRSGTNKTTIYRWWPSKPALLGAALVESRALWFDMPNTGSLRRDLEQLVQAVATLLTAESSAKIAVASLAAAVHSPELALAAKRFFAERLAREQPIFERAKQRHELQRGADPMLIMDLLTGAVWVRVALRQLPLERNFAKNVVRVVLDGLGYGEREKKTRS